MLEKKDSWFLRSASAALIGIFLLLLLRQCKWEHKVYQQGFDAGYKEGLKVGTDAQASKDLEILMSGVLDEFDTLKVTRTKDGYEFDGTKKPRKEIVMPPSRSYKYDNSYLYMQNIK